MRVLWLLWLSLALACGDDGSAPGADAGLPNRWIEIGTGQLEFVAFPADRTLELVQGSQGGVHLDLALRLYGFEPDLALRYEGLLVATGEEVFTPVERLLTPERVIDEGDHLLRAGDRLVLDEALLERGDLVGEEVLVVVTASPPEGPPVRGETRVIVVDER